MPLNRLLNRLLNRFLHRQLRRGNYWMRLGVLYQYPPRPLDLSNNLPIEPKDDGFDRWPSITLVTPSYNQGAYLERTIRSVTSQKYPSLEYFVQDGGSTDDSVDVLRRLEGEISG